MKHGSGCPTADTLIRQAIVRSRAEGIVASNRDGVILFWNPGAERIFGHSAAEVRGQSLDLIIPE
jgi:PAS domain S-box-containing protein